MCSQWCSLDVYSIILGIAYFLSNQCTCPLLYVCVWIIQLYIPFLHTPLRILLPVYIFIKLPHASPLLPILNLRPFWTTTNFITKPFLSFLSLVVRSSSAHSCSVHVWSIYYFSVEYFRISSTQFDVTRALPHSERYFCHLSLLSLFIYTPSITYSYRRCIYYCILLAFHGWFHTNDINHIQLSFLHTSCSINYQMHATTILSSHLSVTCLFCDTRLFFMLFIIHHQFFESSLSPVHNREYSGR